MVQPPTLPRFTIAYAVADYYYRPIDIDGEKEPRCCAVAKGFFALAPNEVGGWVMQHGEIRNQDSSK